MFKKLTLNVLKSAIVKAKCHHMKLFYFSVYCFLLVGCGKKVENTQEQSDVNRSELSSQLIKLKAQLFKSGNAIDEEYAFNSDSEVRIPASINITEGNAGNNMARVYFNAISENEYGFYCNYQGGASMQSPLTSGDIESGKKYIFENCYTQDNNQGEINYYPGYETIQYQNKSIIFELLSADPRYDTSAEAEFEVDFHSL